MSYFYSVVEGLSNVVNSVLGNSQTPDDQNNREARTQQVALGSLGPAQPESGRLPAPALENPQKQNPENNSRDARTQKVAASMRVAESRSREPIGVAQAKLARRNGLTAEVQRVLNEHPRFAEQVCLGLVELYRGGSGPLAFQKDLLAMPETAWPYGRGLRIIFVHNRLVEDAKYCNALSANREFADRIALGFAELAVFDEEVEEYPPRSRPPMLPLYGDLLPLYPKIAHDLSLSLIDLKDDLIKRYLSQLVQTEHVKTLSSAVSWMERENRDLFNRCSNLLFAHPQYAKDLAVSRVMLERAHMSTIRNCEALGVGPEARKIADGIVAFKERQDLLTDERLRVLVENPNFASMLAKKMLADPTKDTRTMIEELFSARVKVTPVPQDLLSPRSNPEADAKFVAIAADYLEEENFCTESNLELLRSNPPYAHSIAMICILIRGSFYFDKNTDPEFFQRLAERVKNDPPGLLHRLTDEVMVAGTPEKFLKIIESCPI